MTRQSMDTTVVAEVFTATVTVPIERAPYTFNPDFDHSDIPDIYEVQRTLRSTLRDVAIQGDKYNVYTADVVLTEETSRIKAVFTYRLRTPNPSDAVAQAQDLTADVVAASETVTLLSAPLKYKKTGAPRGRPRRTDATKKSSSKKTPTKKTPTKKTAPVLPLPEQTEAAS